MAVSQTVCLHDENAALAVLLASGGMSNGRLFHNRLAASLNSTNTSNLVTAYRIGYG
jgi:hypothetical protein